MPQEDFNPTEDERTYKQIKNNAFHGKFYPIEGNLFGTIAAEVTQANKAAFAAKLAELEALAVNLVFKKWDTTALPGKVPMVSVRMQVFSNATVQE